jgi:hypothetical protein
VPDQLNSVEQSKSTSGPEQTAPVIQNKVISTLIALNPWSKFRDINQFTEDHAY